MKFRICIMMLFISVTARSQQPDSVKHFISNALHIMQKNSVFSGNVNWQQVRDTVYSVTSGASTFKDAAPGLQIAFNALGDKHGWLAFGEDEYRNPNFVIDTGRISANMKQAASKGPKIYAGIVNNEYAYISIPFFGGQTEAQMASFAQRIQDTLFTLVNENTRGIIIDLRLNAGGNMFPMIAGLSNVLGETDFAIYPTANKDSIERSSITKNGVAVNGRIITPLPKTYGDLSAHPVALIIGPVTGSAGECLAAGFIGRNKTALIGETTAGFTSANDGFLLHGNDYGMVLSVRVFERQVWKCVYG